MKKNENMSVEHYEVPQAEAINLDLKEIILSSTCPTETCGGNSETPDPECEIDI